MRKYCFLQERSGLNLFKCRSHVRCETKECHGVLAVSWLQTGPKAADQKFIEKSEKIVASVENSLCDVSTPVTRLYCVLTDKASLKNKICFHLKY